MAAFRSFDKTKEGAQITLRPSDGLLNCLLQVVELRGGKELAESNLQHQ